MPRSQKKYNNELIIEREKLQQLVKILEEKGELKESEDYSGGFAEQFSK